MGDYYMQVNSVSAGVPNTPEKPSSTYGRAPIESPGIGEYRHHPYRGPSNVRCTTEYYSVQLPQPPTLGWLRSIASINQGDTFDEVNISLPQILALLQSSSNHKDIVAATDFFVSASYLCASYFVPNQDYSAYVKVPHGLEAYERENGPRTIKDNIDTLLKILQLRQISLGELVTRTNNNPNPLNKYEIDIVNCMIGVLERVDNQDVKPSDRELKEIMQRDDWLPEGASYREMLNLAKIFETLKQWDMLIICYRQGFIITKKNSMDKKSYDVLVNIATLIVEAFNKFKSTFPDNANGMILYIEIFYYLSLTFAYPLKFVGNVQREQLRRYYCSTTAESFIKLGNIYIKNGLDNKALEYLEKGLGIIDTWPASVDLTQMKFRLHVKIAQSRIKINQVNIAREHFDKAKDIYEKIECATYPEPKWFKDMEVEISKLKEYFESLSDTHDNSHNTEVK